MFAWQKQKTWVKIGTVYGILGAVFYIGIMYIWAFLNSQAALLAQYNEPMRYVTFIGLTLFSPLIILPTAVLSLFGPTVTTDARNLVMVISLPLMGALIGTVLNYVIEWWEKSTAEKDINPH